MIALPSYSSHFNKNFNEVFDVALPSYSSHFNKNFNEVSILCSLCDCEEIKKPILAARAAQTRNKLSYSGLT